MINNKRNWESFIICYVLSKKKLTGLVNLLSKLEELYIKKSFGCTYTLISCPAHVSNQIRSRAKKPP